MTRGVCKCGRMVRHESDWWAHEDDSTTHHADGTYIVPAEVFSRAPDWKRLALHALEDLFILGVEIERIPGVNAEVLAEVQRFAGEEGSFL